MKLWAPLSYKQKSKPIFIERVKVDGRLSVKEYLEGWKAYSWCTFFPLRKRKMRTYEFLKSLFDVSELKPQVMMRIPLSKT